MFRPKTLQHLEFNEADGIPCTESVADTINMHHMMICDCTAGQRKHCLD